MVAASMLALAFLASSVFGQDPISELRRHTEHGDADARFNLGARYANGEGVPQDYEEAVRWYRRAAEQGYALAQRSLVDMYVDGRDVSQDDEEVVRWYLRADEQGLASVQSNLVVMYGNGRGVSQGCQRASNWTARGVTSPPRPPHSVVWSTPTSPSNGSSCPLVATLSSSSEP